MAELKYPKRVRFPQGKQKEFLELIKNKLKLTHTEMAELAGVHLRSFTDWKKEKLSMSLPAVKAFSKKANISFPKNIQVKDPFWYTFKGGPLGAKATLEKYGGIGGDPENRKKRWYEWWEKKGKYNKKSICKSQPFKKPGYSKNLAEFFGIMMGDGGMSKSQICITLNSKVDYEYAKFVTHLTKKLFGIRPSNYYSPKDSVINIVVSRRGLVKYLNSIGLVIGNKVKQQIDIPDWIKQKREYQIACIRGLIDTDGCFFHEVHKIKNKIYSYKRINFVNYSYRLVNSVCSILKNLGMKAILRRKGASVQLENLEEIRYYLKIICTHNPKHLKRLGGVG